MMSCRSLTHSLLALLITVGSLGVAAPWSASVSAQETGILVPYGFEVDSVVTGLELPTSFALAADGRIFITEKAGLVRVVQNGQLLPTPFVDISDHVNTVGDRGLMSIALHPRFPAVPWVWLAYVYEPPEASGHSEDGARVSRIVRIQANSSNTNVALPGSEVVVVGTNSTYAHIGNPDRMDARPYTCYDGDMNPIQDCVPNEGNSHNIGTIGFGPDGALYAASGDGINYGWGSLRAQDLNVLAGKILRVNPMTGQGYSSNPFYDGNPDSNRSKVYALGMRNPWRFSFNPRTGELWAADVGNNTYEEINRIPPGANLGWPCFEGPRENAFDPECEPTLSGEWPVTHAYYAYEHEPAGRGAAMGGAFTRGSNFPSTYRNSYFYGEFNVATIERLVQRADGSIESEVFASGVYGAVDIKFSSDGALYFLSIYHGILYRIRYTNTGNRAPIASASASPSAGSPPLSVQFSSSNSYDLDGDPIQVEWDFGDGSSSSERNPGHTYENEGRHAVTLTVTDSGGARSTTELTVDVGNEPPVVHIVSPVTESRVQVGDLVQLMGQATDAEDGEIGGDRLQWQVFLHHNEHIHYDYFSGTGNSTNFNYSDHGDNTYLEICLTASDSQGQETTSCIDLKPREVEYTIQSVPNGLTVTYAGTPYSTPFKVRSHVGAIRRIGAPPTAEGNIQFGSWSDGGALVHDVTIGDQDRTLVVRYVDDAGNLVESEADQEPAAEMVNVPQTTARVRPGGTQDADSDGATPTTSSTAQTDGDGANQEQSGPPAIPADQGAPRGDGAGNILWERWTEVSGNTIADLENHPDYPDKPSSREFLPALETPRTLEPDYGSRIRGYLHPPASDNYRFYIASDDQSGLLLSTDSDPANAFWIAGVTEWAGLRDWHNAPEQRSGYIFLEADERYYIEVLHKQFDGKDNLAVAWQRQGGEIEIIDGQYLSPYVPE